MRKICFLFSVSLILAVLVGVESVFACSCAAKQTVLDEFDSAQNVFVAKVLSIEKGGAKTAIEKVFKGEFKTDEEIFLYSDFSGCSWSLGEKYVGERLLIYNNDKYPFLNGCGRSTLLEDAADDLLYLEKLSKVRGKTRISGKLKFSRDSPLEDGETINKVLDGVKVLIVGKNRTYETKTDKNGIYEIYDLPFGEYVIKPQVPKFMTADYIYSNSSDEEELDEEEYDLQMADQLLLLKPKKHAYFNFVFKVNNIIRGRIYDASGKKMNGVCLKLIPAYGIASKYFYEVECTEKDGKFEFSKIPPGSYYIAGNDDGKISSEEPFGIIYYPGVFEQKNAAVITLGEGDIREGVDLHIPTAVETVTVEGVFLYSDGKPVSEESVEFKAETTTENIEGDARVETDSKGRFSIKILKGLKGKLFGSMYTYPNEFKNCPKLEKLIAENAVNRSYKPETNALEVSAETNIYGVELKFPFPKCEKSKD